MKPSLNRDFVSLVKQMISLRKKNDVIEVQIFFVCQTILYLSSGSSTTGPRVTRRTSSVGRVWVLMVVEVDAVDVGGVRIHYKR